MELDSLFKRAPTEEEREIIHKMFLQNWGQKLGEQPKTTSTYMLDTKLKTVFICHPQVIISNHNSLQLRLTLTAINFNGDD
jgi:hypothetical protein